MTCMYFSKIYLFSSIYIYIKLKLNYTVFVFECLLLLFSSVKMKGGNMKNKQKIPHHQGNSYGV